MATKNLARTAIEGGRVGSNKYDRRASHGEERARQREALSLVKSRDDWDDLSPVIQRKKVYKEFNDKLSPVYAFLDARVGKSWKKVYAEIRTKFDARTTPGRHILFDHMLREVTGSGQQEALYRYFSVGYYIDKQGILRKAKDSKRGHKRMDNKPKPREERKNVNYASLCSWLKGRKVCVKGEKLCWSYPPVPTATVMGDQAYNRGLRWVRADKKGDPILEVIPEGFYTPNYEGAKPYFRDKQVNMISTEKHGWRQGPKLSESECKYFESLPKHIQAILFGVEQPS